MNYSACYDTTAIMTKEFCAKCGNKALHRVPVTVEENGTMHMQLDMERLKVTRGLKYPLKPIRGGKHELVEKVFEDQRIAQNRMARIKKVFLKLFCTFMNVYQILLIF